MQSGTGFLKSESFDGELGFKTDNVSRLLAMGGARSPKMIQDGAKK